MAVVVELPEEPDPPVVESGVTVRVTGKVSGVCGVPLPPPEGVASQEPLTDKTRSPGVLILRCSCVGSRHLSARELLKSGSVVDPVVLSQGMYPLLGEIELELEPVGVGSV